MPSSSIESWARLREIVPLRAFGQMNRPRSSRLMNRHRPSPSNHKTLIVSPRRPRNTNTWPEKGCCCNTVCTCALRPSKSGKDEALPLRPPLRTGHESFPSSGSSHVEALWSGEPVIRDSLSYCRTFGPLCKIRTPLGIEGVGFPSDLQVPLYGRIPRIEQPLP